LLYAGAAWVLKDSVLTTLDPATGEVLKRGRLADGKAGTNASPVGADGKVYVATTDGKVVVLSAAAQWEVLAENDMGEPIHATPAIAGGDLFVRTDSRMYRLTAAAPQPGR
jgi:outer membrane protein assembly factor BamB